VRRSLSLPVGQRQLQVMTAPSQSAGNARSCGRGRPLARPRGRLTGIKYVVLVHIDPVWCVVQLVQTPLPSRCTGMRVISPPSPCPALFPFENLVKLGKGSTAGGFSLAPGNKNITSRGRSCLLDQQVVRMQSTVVIPVCTGEYDDSLAMVMVMVSCNRVSLSRPRSTVVKEEFGLRCTTAAPFWH
jgi:hypothetical protein